MPVTASLFLVRRRLCRPVTVAPLLFLPLLSSSAYANENRACASAAEAAQQLRLDGKLRKARDKLLFCSQRACPSVVRRDCDKWFSEVDASLPSIVLSARDQQGHDLVDVQVLMDGTPLVQRLDGKAIPVDPGVHVLRFDHPGAQAVSRRVLIREGEKNRGISVRLGPQSQAPSRATAAAQPHAAAPATQPSTTKSPSPPVGPDRHAQTAGGRTSWVGFMLLGVGVVAGAAFAYLDVSGQNDFQRCRDSHTCSTSELDSLKLRRGVAWSVLGVSALSLGGAAFFFFGSRSRPPRAALAIRPASDGASAVVRATF